MLKLRQVDRAAKRERLEERVQARLTLLVQLHPLLHRVLEHRLQIHLFLLQENYLLPHPSHHQ